MIAEEERLETPKQFAASRGLSERQVRDLIRTRQLEHVMIGSRALIPMGAWRRFLDARTVKPCHDATRVPDFVGSTNVGVSISPGPSVAAAASAQLARATANKLKLSSLNGCNTEAAAPAQVIPLRSS